jgi:hypothetical protein
MLNAYGDDELVDDPITPAMLKQADPFRGDPRMRPGRPPVLEPERREISDAEAQRRWLLDNAFRHGRITEEEWRGELATPPRGSDRPRTPQVRVIPSYPLGGRTTGPVDPFEGLYAPRPASIPW